MTASSRRTFIRNASTSGVAVGLAAVSPALLGSPASAAAHGAAAPAPASGKAHQGPFVAYVKNAKAGEIAVLVGEREVVHHDKDLATRLAQVAATGS
ncbi:hypothetical protein GXW83_17290 [Streptacidiphilus sp. PB12-B1b]|uniref:hypothetical protein n=1 Tax=Streptacidiphilus sp. PB12-B1b TaxID=2705012 RepID=UPI0015FA81F5|nr:hypothetical protein [Streptacidiphilus sp. PB12-B1b]QMU77200.1 hypothetical protein GXW83_17290 [Streptacidiphilus sp. PB12-B1b]